MEIEILSRHPYKKATKDGDTRVIADVLYRCNHYMIVKPRNGSRGRYLRLNTDRTVSVYICDMSWTEPYERIISMCPVILKEIKSPSYLYWQYIST